MQQIISRVIAWLHKCKSWLSLLTWIAVAFGLSKDWANPIWESTLLAWYWPSKTVVLVLLLVLALCISTLMHLRKLVDEIDLLKKQLAFNKLSPEEKASHINSNLSEQSKTALHLVSQWLGTKP
jgi:hypothetical protein